MSVRTARAIRKIAAVITPEVFYGDIPTGTLNVTGYGRHALPGPAPTPSPSRTFNPRPTLPGPSAGRLTNWGGRFLRGARGFGGGIVGGIATSKIGEWIDRSLGGDGSTGANLGYYPGMIAGERLANKFLTRQGARQGARLALQGGQRALPHIVNGAQTIGRGIIHGAQALGHGAHAVASTVPALWTAANTLSYGSMLAGGAGTAGTVAAAALPVAVAAGGLYGGYKIGEALKNKDVGIWGDSYLNDRLARDSAVSSAKSDQHGNIRMNYVQPNADQRQQAAVAVNNARYTRRVNEWAKRSPATTTAQPSYISRDISRQDAHYTEEDKARGTYNRANAQLNKLLADPSSDQREVERLTYERDRAAAWADPATRDARWRQLDAGWAKTQLDWKRGDAVKQRSDDQVSGKAAQPGYKDPSAQYFNADGSAKTVAQMNAPTTPVQPKPVPQTKPVQRPQQVQQPIQPAPQPVQQPIQQPVKPAPKPAERSHNAWSYAPSYKQAIRNERTQGVKAGERSFYYGGNYSGGNANKGTIDGRPTAEYFNRNKPARRV